MSRSTDLRERALASLSGGMAPRQVATIFGISRATLYRWKAQHQEGQLHPRTSPGGIRRIAQEQEAALLAQVQAHPDAYVREHVQLWHEGQGQRVSLSTMQRTLLRLNQTRKKSVCEP